MVTDDADRLIGVEHRDQPGERCGLADEQTRAAPVDRIEVGVDLHQARGGLGLGPAAEGGQTDESAPGQPLDEALVQPVPGRHQHRQEGAAERIREHGPTRSPARPGCARGRARRARSIGSRAARDWRGQSRAAGRWPGDWRRSARGHSPRATAAPPRAPAADRGARPAPAGGSAPGGRARHRRHATTPGSLRRVPRRHRARLAARPSPVTVRPPEQRSDRAPAWPTRAVTRSALRAAPSSRNPGLRTGRVRHARSIAPASACGVNSLSHTTSAKSASTRRSARVLCSVSVAVSNGTRTIGLWKRSPSRTVL